MSCLVVLFTNHLLTKDFTCHEWSSYCFGVNNNSVFFHYKEIILISKQIIRTIPYISRNSVSGWKFRTKFIDL